MAGKIVILEVDSCYIRGGYAGDHSPRFEISAPNLFEGYTQIAEACRHVFFNILLTKPKDCSVLLIEDTLVNQKHQCRLITALLRDIQVNSVSIQSKFHMAMIASGLSTGVVVSIGESSYCYAFAYSRPIFHSLRWTDFTGAPVDSPKVVDADELAYQLLECLKSCNSDLRPAVSRGIFVCGRESRVSGLSENICKRATHFALNDPDYQSCLAQLIQKLPDQQIRPVVTPFNSALLSWVGGSLFASLPSNQKTFLKAAQLIRTEENGETLFVPPDSMSLVNATW